MITTIIVMGKSGSGKTEMSMHLKQLLEADGFTVKYLSDRIGLEDAVLEDTKDGQFDEFGALVGPHSKLIADGEPGHRKVHVLDGTLLNQVHFNMVNEAARLQNPTIVLMEYAIGENVDFGSRKEPLIQSAYQLVGLLSLRDHRNLSLIIDVEASVDVRAIRNASRADGLDETTFRQFFGDGGEMPEDLAEILGDHYVRLDNGFHDIEAFRQEAERLFFDIISPRLPQDEWWREGSIRRERGEV